MRALGWVLGIGLSALCGAFGCQSIGDIEERSLASGADSPQCVEYCDTVMENCTDGLAVYVSQAVCLDVCAALDPGDDLEPGNTVACRLSEAKEAEREADLHCPNAGPGGGGVCGTDCEAWCGLLEQACPSDYAALEGKCEARCAGITDEAEFSVETHYLTDTLECRLIHVGAALSAPDAHCGHAKFNPTEKCVPGADEPPSCENMCRHAQSACTGELAVYDDEEQCVAACELFDLGKRSGTTENTVGCREYHASSAGTAAATHCPHAGPSGDGHCGDYEEDSGQTGNCESYCLLVGAACGGDPDYPFASPTDCEDTCEVDFAEKGAAKDSGYSVESAEGAPDSLQCRTLHAVRALTDDANCAAAFGAAPCE